MDDIHDLVLAPFRDIVDKAKLAITNAGHDHQDMLKAAQALLKEGERGLKRLEPLCRKHLDDYGAIFISSLKDSDDVACYRTDLTDMLWEFDDYIETEDFDADKFKELQSLSRKAAPKISDIILRMKLDAPFGSDAASSRGSVAPITTPTSPPYHPGTVFPLPTPRTSINKPQGEDHDVSDQLSAVRIRSCSSHTSHSDQVREPPKPPSSNPWDWHASPGEERRSMDAPHSPNNPLEESPVLPSASPHGEMNFTVVHPPPVDGMGRRAETADIEMDQHRVHSTHAAGAESREYVPYMPLQNQSTAQPMWQSTVNPYAIPEHQISSQHASIPFFQSANTPFASASGQNRQLSFPPMSDASEAVEPPQGNVAQGNGIGMQNAEFQGLPRTLKDISPSQIPETLTLSDSAPEPLQPEQLADMDFAPIPVESETIPQPAQAPQVPSERGIIDSKSSFQLTKGFCEGAKEVLRGGIGVKRTKKPGFAASSTVARCISCLYELDFANIETDVKREDKGTYVRSGVRFRLRFLQKSHVTTRRIDDVQFGCVFCVHEKHTVNKSDATLFNQQALFEHLARHPRPLPKVPGVTVIETADVPEEHRNDFDIHFRQPPQIHPVVERASEIAALGCGTAKAQARKPYGQMLPFDRSPALEVSIGAKIIGLTWPPKYQGEWCMGWHDGKHAAIPYSFLKLEPPPEKEIRYDRSSTIRATARWKFAVKDKERDNVDWLKFDKNETISNIARDYPDHWCWTGTNSKGKSGIFPAAFIEPTSVREATGATATREGSLNEELVRSSSSVLSKMLSKKYS